MFMQDVLRDLTIKSSLDQVWFKIYLDLEVQSRFMKTTMRISLSKDRHKRRAQVRYALIDALDLDTPVTNRDLKDWATTIEIDYLRLTQGEFSQKSVMWSKSKT